MALGDAGSLIKGLAYRGLIHYDDSFGSESDPKSPRSPSPITTIVYHTHTHHICVQRTSNSLELTAYKLFVLLYMVVSQDDSSKKTPPWFKDEKPAQVLR